MIKEIIMIIKNNKQVIAFFCLLFVFCSGCTKLTQVGEPVNTITTTETFSTDATATSAIIGIYNDLLTGNGNGFSFGNGATTASLGMSADELHLFNGPSLFEINTLSAEAGSSDLFWLRPYFDIYLANAALEALPGSAGVSAGVKNQLIGEAKFFRAFCHFYLVNLYGDVPYVTTTAYAVNDTVSRQPVARVYQQIIADLKDAQNLLAVDYSFSGSQRVRVNKYGAAAMLARTYLYTDSFALAEAEADTVIGNTGLFSLVSDLNTAFLANSTEAILQWETANIAPYATTEGNTFIPYDSTANPQYYLTTQLLNSFEPNDQRRIAWVDSTDYLSTFYYYPFKYKVYVGTQGYLPEYYTILRLAEQYLIRAEARAQQNNLSGAIADLDVIRNRAGLDSLSPSLTQPQVLAAVAQERRIELFAEWGHRWLDLKRTGQADAVLGAIKPTWQPNAKLYPLPSSELLDDANLIQNPGY
jgi:hypothetical protein